MGGDRQRSADAASAAGFAIATDGGAAQSRHASAGGSDHPARRGLARVQPHGRFFWSLPLANLAERKSLQRRPGW